MKARKTALAISSSRNLHLTDSQSRAALHFLMGWLQSEVSTQPITDTKLAEAINEAMAFAVRSK